MSARTYRLQRRLPSPNGTGKWCFVCDLNSMAAARHESVRDRISLVEPGWQHRVVEQATGEVTRLDEYGNPVVLDRRTDAEVEADLGAERYERELERLAGECA